MSVAGILLAAGLGRRMGVPKALITWEGTLLVDHGVDLLAAGGCDPVVVVLGAGAPEVRKQARLEATVVVAEHWALGMGESLCAGLLAAADANADAVVVALVDQPFVAVEAVRRVIAANAEGATAAVAEYDGKPRNPVLLAREHWADVSAAVAGTDEGARRWLREHPDLVTGVDCTGTGSPADLDTPADLALLKQHAAPPANRL